MTDKENTLFCDECDAMTLHERVDLEPLKPDTDSNLFQRATIVISNSIDSMLNTSYHQCHACGATFGYTENEGGF